MVGIPTSNRCSFCKSRKTKCDQAWPTCGACKRAGRECSGPPKFKFVHNGRHSTAPETEQQRKENNLPIWPQDAGPMVLNTSIVEVGKPIVQEAGTFGKLRFRRNIPRAVPPTALDRLSSRLVQCLESSQGTGHDLGLWGSSFSHIPSRLAKSVALRHSTELLVSCWTNSRKGVPPEELLDLKLYGKALRSLQKMLEIPNEQLSVSTLASASVLQKIEIIFDLQRVANRESHAAGLYEVIRRRGLPMIMDEFDIHLLFENYPGLIKYDLIKGRDSFLFDPSWIHGVEEVLDRCIIKPEALLAEYKLWIAVGAWPSISRGVRLLGRDPENINLAKTVLRQAGELGDKLRHIEEVTMPLLKEHGDIIERDDHNDGSVCEKRYEFSSYEVGRWFTYHMMFLIVTNIAAAEANRCMGIDELDLADRNRILSRHIWMSYAYMEKKKPLALEVLAPLCFTYESGSTDEKAFVIQALKDLEEFRRPPVGIWVEETILSNVRAFTGRLPYLKTQNIDVEMHLQGARS